MRMIILPMLTYMIVRIYIFMKLYIPVHKNMVSKQVKQFISLMIMWISQEGTPLAETYLCSRLDYKP